MVLVDSTNGILDLGMVLVGASKRHFRFVLVLVDGNKQVLGLIQYSEAEYFGKLSNHVVEAGLAYCNPASIFRLRSITGSASGLLVSLFYVEMFICG